MNFWRGDGRQFTVDSRSSIYKDLWQQPPLPAKKAPPVDKRSNRGATGGYGNDKCSMFDALYSYRLLGYWSGLLPVQGLLGNNPQLLRYNSVQRQFNHLYLLLGRMTNSYERGLVSKNSAADITHSTALIFGPLFWGIFTLRQATLFPALLKKWTRVEKEMQTIGSISKLKTHLNIITAINIIATLGSSTPCNEGIHQEPAPPWLVWEGTIACIEMAWYDRIAPCTEDFIVKLQVTLLASFNSLHIPVNYLSWAAPIAFFVHIYYRFIWMFTELTFLVLSYSLYRLFKQYQDHVESVKGKDMSAQFWYKMRLHYNSLSRLTKTLDDFLSPNTCITFAVDIFFVCYSLFHVFKRNPLTNKKLMYFLCYNVSRTLSIALLGSYINDLSKKPLLVLYSVPSKSFCGEVLRFQMEILADDICLTGCRFFSITRSFIITVVGTIATYEVVLIQFNTLQNEEFEFTSFCSAFTSYNIVPLNNSIT
ncbi:gustatory receptor for sugar taste 64e-like [Macrosteles quadrilineatus]|uniref:gustatory receptor for sugar taste 64e-like n=1 Tax=Macrosteles quadrilineatus TaxID=74068 RepID=UPI0023E1EF99|nr:gustatory receptor for sugar taste 64e-like [Macrosteles quadrilineatus]